MKIARLKFLAVTALFLASGLCLTAGKAGAQVPAPAPASSVFAPTSAWLVGPSSPLPERSGSGIPCVMMNQYNNGYSFRIAAGDKQIYALAIDFRQSVFLPNQSYEIGLSVPPDFNHTFEGVAYTDGTLLVNTRATPELYEALSDGSRLVVAIGGKTLDFALLGVSEGLVRTAACYKGGEGGPVHPVAAPDAKRADAAGKEAGSGENHGRMTVGKMVAEAAQAVESMPGPEVGGAEKEQVKEAKGQAMVPGWQPPSDGPRKTRQEPKDILVNYDPKREIQEAAGDADATGEKEISYVRNWRAMRGANLREILDIWASKENVRFVWMAGQDFPVEDSISVQGTFEAAVLSLLQQYDGMAVRPVGKIYNTHDVSQPKVLLVELAGG